MLASVLVEALYPFKGVLHSEIVRVLLSRQVWSDGMGVSHDAISI